MRVHSGTSDIKSELLFGKFPDIPPPNEQIKEAGSGKENQTFQT